MNFDSEISTVDCISKENYFSHFNIENTPQSLETPSLSALFSARKFLSARSLLMHLVYKNKNILFPSNQLIIHSLTHVD